MAAEKYLVEFRVLSIGNNALQPYYTVEVPMFRHRFEDSDQDVLLVDEERLDEEELPEGPVNGEYLQFHADGIPADPDHHRIESMTEVSA